MWKSFSFSIPCELCWFLMVSKIFCAHPLQNVPVLWNRRCGLEAAAYGDDLPLGPKSKLCSAGKEADFHEGIEVQGALFDLKEFEISNAQTEWDGTEWDGAK